MRLPVSPARVPRPRPLRRASRPPRPAPRPPLPDRFHRLAGSDRPRLGGPDLLQGRKRNGHRSTLRRIAPAFGDVKRLFGCLWGPSWSDRAPGVPPPPPRPPPPPPPPRGGGDTQQRGGRGGGGGGPGGGGPRAGFGGRGRTG